MNVAGDIVFNRMLQVISLETNHVGEVFPGSQREVREYLEERGYVMAATVGGKILLKKS